LLKIWLGGHDLVRKQNPVSKRSWTALSPRQKLFRERSLEVLRKSRKSSQSLSKIAKDFGISAKTVIHNTDAFRKINRKWVPKKYDKISRVMKISENGKELSVEINDSRRASIIGKYHNSVRKFLESGDEKVLSKFKNKRIKDTNHIFHLFETDPNKIIEINSRIEEPEFYEVYAN
jgi:hypothetical protein